MKLLLVSILLVIVYQFDELVSGLLHVVSRLRKRKYKAILLNSDHYVGTALTIATMPLFLNYVLNSDQTLVQKLFLLALIYLVFAVLSYGIGFFIKQFEKLNHYNGYTLVFASLQTAGSLFHPAFNAVLWHAGRERLVYAKLAFLLSLPAMLGLGFKLVYEQYAGREFGKYLDVLIIVMVGGLFIRIVISALESYFKKYSVGVLALYRIALGLAITLLLIR